MNHIIPFTTLWVTTLGFNLTFQDGLAKPFYSVFIKIQRFLVGEAL
jgi:hypothetical protein